MPPASHNQRPQSILLTASVVFALVTALLTLSIVGFGQGNSTSQAESAIPLTQTNIAATIVAVASTATPTTQSYLPPVSVPPIPSIQIETPTTSLPTPTNTTEPTVAPTPASQFEVVSLALVDTVTGQPISEFVPLQNGVTIDLALLPNREITILATTQPDVVGSVVFELNGAVQIENTTPYAMVGDQDERYFAWAASPGFYTLRVTPYTDPNASGSPGTPLEVQFSVIDSNPPT